MRDGGSWIGRLVSFWLGHLVRITGTLFFLGADAGATQQIGTGVGGSKALRKVTQSLEADFRTTSPVQGWAIPTGRREQANTFLHQQRRHPPQSFWCAQQLLFCVHLTSLTRVPKSTSLLWSSPLLSCTLLGMSSSSSRSATHHLGREQREQRSTGIRNGTTDHNSQR